MKERSYCRTSTAEDIKKQQRKRTNGEKKHTQKNNPNVDKIHASIENIRWTHTNTYKTMQRFIETPFKVHSSRLSVEVENYCSDPTSSCTIKTQAGEFGAGIFISCGI